jgi:3-oxoacyl-[acyl-carrier protein] reductase
MQPFAPLALQQAKPLSGRTALVTGVSRRIGIGFAIAARLVQCGANIFIHSWVPFDAAQPWGGDAGGSEAIVRELRAHGTSGTRIEHLAADFRDPAAPAQVVDAAVQAFGHIDMLIANHAYGTMGGLEELTADEIDAHLEANVRGTLLLIKAWAAQHDDSRRGGRVIMMTSGQHLGPMEGELAYIASKGALHQLTFSLAAHLAPRNITVNTINPGATDTGYATPEVYQHVLEHSPRGRWGQPDDAARLITWLMTDDAEWVNGQVINSTGSGL